MLNEQELKSLEKKLLNELRAAENLPPHIFKTRKVYGTEVSDNPGTGKISYSHESGSFTYCNINGGDSSAYYYITENPKVMYNHKGEPNFVIRQFDRTYADKADRLAKKVKAQKKRREAYAAKQEFLDVSRAYLSGKNETIVYFAFRDAKTDKYFVGSFNHDTQELDINAVSSKERAYDFLAQHGVDEPELIETWDYSFKPENAKVFDVVNRFVNKFQLSKYLKAAVFSDNPVIPKNISRVLTHVLNGDDELIEHFLNWLACIVQYRCRTESAWILQGTTGTGKGILVRIIRKIIGEDYVRSVTIANLEDNFNGFMDQCLLVFVDEVDTDQVRAMEKLIAKLKALITEPNIAVRAMRTDLFEVPNHVNIVMASNQANSMRIEENDRRFNVANRQESKLLDLGESGDTLMSMIDSEIQDFTNYLMSRVADRSLARTAIDNDAKRQLQQTTQTAMEEISQALLTGDLEYFIHHRPPTHNDDYRVHTLFDGHEVDLRNSYYGFLLNAGASIENGGKHYLDHQDLFVIYESLNGKMPNTKIKLTKRLRYHRVNIAVVNTGKDSIRGIVIEWNATQEQLNQWEKLSGIHEYLESLQPKETGNVR